jgi:asparagine N-glycosylation enzyme membrane subunit Stt3
MENESEIKIKEEIISKREDKFINFLKKPEIWAVGFLILLIILGVYIRIQPLNINSNTGKPGLWDIATNTWTLGPDLDPWLFTRYAQTIVENGSLPVIDSLRNVPLGFDVSKETQLLPMMIVGVYYFLNIFSNNSVMFAALIFPVIMFGLTIISFFLFVREVFVRKNKNATKANIIALISTLFMTVIPALLPRTIAGIPEKESAAFFFLFLSLYFFLKAWKSEKTKNYITLSILAGVSTACLGAVWGGVLYAFIAIALSVFIAFILNKVHKKELIIYVLWVISSFSLIVLYSKYKISDLVSSLDTGLVCLVLLVLIIHNIIWNTKIRNFKILNTGIIPKSIISSIVATILVFIIVLIFLGPNFIISKVDAVNHALLTPVTGRWQITVAENRQPYFTEWGASFGPYIKNIPIVFWLFFAGSILLLTKIFESIKKKDLWVLIGLYIFFFLGLVFSRYSASSVFNGENFISRVFYYGSAIIFLGFLIYYYIKDFREGNNKFEMVDFEYILLFSLFLFCLVTTRGAVRLVMVLAPIAPIFIGYLIVELTSKLFKIKDDVWKVIAGFFILIIILAGIFSCYTFYQESKGQAQSMIPSYYNQQWQKAMNWVKTETPTSAVFAHWWDYGYWVQSIGNRATITDGGNAISFWNYYMGRLVLTGDNQKDALDFLYSHNATYLLIDSSDIGKYSAFSSIGSDAKYDRYSWVGTFLQDEKQTVETRNETDYVYLGGTAMDEDLIINDSGKEILLPGQAAGIGAIVLPTTNLNSTIVFGQPYIITVYQNKQYKVNLRYLSVNGEFKDFKSGIEATAFIFPSLTMQGQSVSKNPIGAAMYLSPRLMRGMLAQIYILEDPFKKFTNFNLTHSEPNLIIADLNKQGMSLPKFVYFQGVQGPIDVWKINYKGDEKFNPAYTDKVASKYLNWSL